jgi:putative FmdB family regulatory protein
VKAMPLYEYLCTACKHEFEALVRSQDPAPACPSCKSADLEKLLSGFAVSSSESRAASALDSRKRQVRANKDKVVADEEYRKDHEGH